MTQTNDIRWIHRWSVFTACTTFALLFLGSLVTTRHAGMADPIWPTYPWHLLLIDWTEPEAGFLIEHSHRAAGYIVGCCIIVLMFALWFGQRRRWLKWLGVAALGAVIAQGLLGGFRVKLDELLGPDLAFVHGCFAQLVFALIVTIAVVTSKKWLAGLDQGSVPLTTGRLRWVTLFTLGLVYTQIVFGALLRHTFAAVGPRGHLLVAFAVVAAVVWIAKDVWERHRKERALFAPVLVLVGLVLAQLLMGVETWMLRYTYTAAGVGYPVGVRTAHVLLGSLIFATTVIVTLQARRRVALAIEGADRGSEHLEGAA
jgi:cytochrome c oxidase assembly protein subunit 15